MKINKKIVSLLLIFCMVLTFSSCSSIKTAIKNVLNADEEKVDTLTRATVTSNEIALPEIADSTARFETYFPEETQDMYVVFNGIASRDTDYFYAPNGTLTLTSKATGESTGMKSFKIALWEKLDGATKYVEDSTVYFYTNEGEHTYTIKGLNPETPYRINFSYDAYGYYIYGTMHVEGAVETLPEPEQAEGEDGEATE